MLTVSAASFADRPPPARPWLVRDLIPVGSATGLSGEGGVGKGNLAIQLGLSVSTGTEWLGRPVMAGPVLGIFSEDDSDELGRRLIQIANGAGVDLADAGAFHLIGSDHLAEGATLAVMADGKLAPTGVFGRIAKLVSEIKPALIILDPVAELAAIDENKRSEVAAFVRLLNGLAASSGAALVLISHPSLTGIASGSGLSGSTAWSNSVRSRLFLTAPDANDPDRRRLALVKSNYARSGVTIDMRIVDGRFVAMAGAGSAEQREVEAKAEASFMAVLGRLTAEGRPVSATPSTNFAPTVFAGEPEAEGLDKRMLKEAMKRLFAAGVLRVEEFGPQSRRRSRIVEAPSNGSSNIPTNAVPTASNAVCSLPPYTPSTVGTAAGVGTPQPASDTEAEVEQVPDWFLDPTAGMEPEHGFHMQEGV